MEDAATTAVGCIVIIFGLVFWILVIWGLWELIHLIARS